MSKDKPLTVPQIQKAIAKVKAAGCTIRYCPIEGGVSIGGQWTTRLTAAQMDFFRKENRGEEIVNYLRTKRC